GNVDTTSCRPPPLDPRQARQMPEPCLLDWPVVDLKGAPIPWVGTAIRALPIQHTVIRRTPITSAELVVGAHSAPPFVEDSDSRTRPGQAAVVAESTPVLVIVVQFPYLSDSAL